jgi:hypothetical protein
MTEVFLPEAATALPTPISGHFGKEPPCMQLARDWIGMDTLQRLLSIIR